MYSQPPLVGRLQGTLYAIAFAGAAAIGVWEGAVGPIERLYGGCVASGDVTWEMDGWSYDHRDDSVSGLVVYETGRRIGSIARARLSLFLMDEVTYDLERVGVIAEAAIRGGGHRAEWRVRRHPVPFGKRFRGVALDGSYDDAEGHAVAIGSELACGGPSWNEGARIAGRCRDLVAGGEAGVSDAVAALHARDPIDRAAAATALGEIGRRPDLSVTALLDRLRTERYTLVRENVFDALGRFGAQASTAVPDIRDAACSSAERDGPRRAALIALGRVGPGASMVVPDLVRVLSSDRMIDRLLAATSLGQMGPAAREARPALERLAAGTNDSTTGSAAREALARIGD